MMKWQGLLYDMQLICMVLIIHPWLHVEEFSWLWLCRILSGVVLIILILYIKHDAVHAVSETEGKDEL